MMKGRMPIIVLLALGVASVGGYVILPPSIRSDGTPYVWANALPPADAPLWLIHAVSSHHQTQARTRSTARNYDGMPSTSPRTHAWAMAALRIACERIATAADGTCNHTLNAEAFDLFRLVAAGYLNEGHVRARLLAAASEREIDVEYGESSVLNTINSAATAGLAQPRFYQGR
jgi:putative DNA primase/helicase